MRIYIENINNININKLKNYLRSKNKINYAYTDRGIFTYNEKGLQKIDFYDKHVTYVSNYDDKYNLILDTSLIKPANKHYTLPYNHKLEEVTEEIYTLREKSFVKLIIETNNNNNLPNFYLETKENIENIPIKEDICTLLSLIN
mgnify:CR=1 FL=1